MSWHLHTAFKKAKHVYDRTSMLSGTEQMTVTLKITGNSRYHTDKAPTYISVAKRKF